MKLIIEVLGESANQNLPLLPEAEGKTVLVLSEDGKHITPGSLQLPGFDDMPDLSLIRITRIDGS